MDFPALQEALDALSQAALAIDNGWPYSVEAHLTEASLAAAVAFPAGSDEAGHLLALISAVEAEARAAGLLEAAWAA